MSDYVTLVKEHFHPSLLIIPILSTTEDTANVTRNKLQQVFPNRVIGVRHATEWPPRSPDLTPCDFCLWGYLKQRVYVTPQRTIQELQQRIQNEVAALRRIRIVRRAVHHMTERAQRCIRLNGHQVEGRSAGV